MLAKSDLPVLVDFNATWCGPCQMMSKVISSLSKQLDGKVRFIKIDTDKYPKLASQHRIQGLPTLVLFKNGQPIDRMEGYMSEQQLADRLKYALSKSG